MSLIIRLSFIVALLVNSFSIKAEAMELTINENVDKCSQYCIEGFKEENADLGEHRYVWFGEEKCGKTGHNCYYDEGDDACQTYKDLGKKRIGECKPSAACELVCFPVGEAPSDSQWITSVGCDDDHYCEGQGTHCNYYGEDRGKKKKSSCKPKRRETPPSTCSQMCLRREGEYTWTPLRECGIAYDCQAPFTPSDVVCKRENSGKMREGVCKLKG